MPSMPQPASWRALATSLQVHVFTARPRSWQRVISASSTVGSQGWIAAWPRFDDLVDLFGGHRRERQPRRRHGGLEGAAPVDRLHPERRDEPVRRRLGTSVQQSDHGPGDALGRVEVGRARLVLDLDVDERPSTRIERRGERRHVIREVGSQARHDRPPVAEIRVVVDHQRAVGRASDVELDAGGAHRHGRLERRTRVLARRPRRPTVGNDVRHVAHVTPCHRPNP